MHTIFNIFYGIFIGLLVLVGGLFLLSFLPVETGIETKIVQSGSMEPSIPVGALVFVRPFDSYKVGDVITFGEDTASRAPTTHRIVGVRKIDGTDYYMTKGDANEEKDNAEVARREVMGKVLLSVPYAGFVLSFAKQPIGFAILIGVPALLIIVSELASIAQEILRSRRRRVPRPVQRRLPKIARPGTQYARVFMMDDIFIPVRRFERQVRSSLPSHYKGALTSTMAVMCIAVVVSFQYAGTTLSYFHDLETSLGNTFSAAAEFETLSTAVSEPEQVVEENPEQVQDEDVASGGEETIGTEETPREREGREGREVREGRDDAPPIDPEELILEEVTSTPEETIVTEETIAEEPPPADAL